MKMRRIILAGTSTHILIEALRYLRVNARIVRCRVSPARLDGVPELPPKRGDLGSFARRRWARDDHRRSR
jgi:hypothetical protein